MTADLAFEVDDAMSLSEPSLNVSESFVDDGDLGRMVRLEFAGSLVGGQYWGELFDSDANKLGSVFREIRVFGEHHRDRLAYVPLNPSLPQLYRRNIQNIRRCPGRDHRRKRQGAVELNGYDPAMSLRGANDPHMQLVREVDIGRKATATQHQRSVLKP
jgi:hypothetical protein